jgi:hypothetical protein
MNLLDRLTAAGPKRILALDGGGIRGALTLGYLKHIEDILRTQHGNDPEFRLCDYFDLIGGTSTGSIIAGCLAIGMKVDDIREMYFELGGSIFATKKSWLGRIGLGLIDKATYDSAPLENELHKVFGDMTICSDKIKTGLCIVTKRADTNSTWPIINHPNGKYFNSDFGKNKDIILYRAIRASAAAPTYFTPQVIDVGGDNNTAAFVDGGVSTANNPSLMLLLVATLQGFPFHWPLGDDNLLVVSVGTGGARLKGMANKLANQRGIGWASLVPTMLMQDSSSLNETVMQWISKSPTAVEINGEMGNLMNDLLSSGKDGPAMVSYLRYNTTMNRPHLESLMEKSYTDAEVDYLIEMSHADNRYVLYDIGERAGKMEVKPAHFSEKFKRK